MKLGLGTVQFGLNYGIANKNGQCDDAQLSQILDLAYRNELKILDTAPSYGNAEKRLGNSELISRFKVITKIDLPFKDNYDPKYTETQINNSLRNLKLSSVYGCLCHDPNVMTSSFGPKLIEHLSMLKSKGCFEKIGVSIYDLEEIDVILNFNEINLVQLPLNIFDQRFLVSGALKRLKENNIEIHVRSAFLQGLLLMPTHLVAKEKPEAACQIQRLYHRSNHLNFSVLELCLGFVSNIKEVDHILVGANNLSQLEQIVSAYGRDVLSSDLEDLSVSDPRILDPRIWSDVRGN